MLACLLSLALVAQTSDDAVVQIVQPPQAPLDLGFGSSCSIDGDRAVVSEYLFHQLGAFGCSIEANQALRIYERASATGQWTLVQTLAGPPSIAGTDFKLAADVTLVGDMLVTRKRAYMRVGGVWVDAPPYPSNFAARVTTDGSRVFLFDGSLISIFDLGATSWIPAGSFDTGLGSVGTGAPGMLHHAGGRIAVGGMSAFLVNVYREESTGFVLESSFPTQDHRDAATFGFDGNTLTIVSGTNIAVHRRMGTTWISAAPIALDLQDPPAGGHPVGDRVVVGTVFGECRLYEPIGPTGAWNLAFAFPLVSVPYCMWPEFNGMGYIAVEWPVLMAGDVTRSGGHGLAAFVDLDQDPLGDVYCSAANASDWQSGARLYGTGSSSVATNDLVLRCAGLPVGATTILLASRSSAVVNVLGGLSRLCLGAPLGRFVRPGEVTGADANGVITVDVDLLTLPLGGSIAAAAPGETWYFQALHRDPLRPSGANLSSAVSITFGP